MAVVSTETLVEFHRTTERYIPEDSSFHILVVCISFAVLTNKNGGISFPWTNVFIIPLTIL
jgi:hypothetical protein